MVLSNESRQKGVVCADAVRFGGGMGNISRGGKTSGHAWNKIKLDGEWYHVDVTWEDPIMNGDPENGYGYGNLRNEYINITDSKMAKDHRWTAKEPACKATKYGRSAVSKYMKKRY